MSNTVDLILELQAEKGLNNKQLEIACELPNATISQWKNGKSNPSTDAIRRLAAYFKCTTDYLMGVSESREISKLTEEEELILSAFRSASTEGRFRIIQVCMNERREPNV